MTREVPEIPDCMFASEYNRLFVFCCDCSMDGVKVDARGYEAWSMFTLTTRGDAVGQACRCPLAGLAVLPPLLARLAS